MSNKSDTYKKKLLEGLIKYKGIVTDACKYANCSRKTYYKYLKDDEDFAEEAKDAQGQALDFVEGKLFSLIEQENPTAIIFYLKTKGKKRGYVERQEVKHDGNNLKISVQVFGEDDPVLDEPKGDEE